MRKILALLAIAASSFAVGTLLPDVFPGPTEVVRTWVARQPIINLVVKPKTRAPMYWPEEGKGTRRIYVREYEDYRPPNGAPIFYAPYPETLCMLGMGAEGPRVIYEAKEGACSDVIGQLR